MHVYLEQVLQCLRLQALLMSFTTWGGALPLFMLFNAGGHTIKALWILHLLALIGGLMIAVTGAREFFESLGNCSFYIAFFKETQSQYGQHSFADVVDSGSLSCFIAYSCCPVRKRHARPLRGYCNVDWYGLYVTCCWHQRFTNVHVTWFTSHSAAQVAMPRPSCWTRCRRKAADPSLGFTPSWMTWAKVLGQPLWPAGSEPWEELKPLSDLDRVQGWVACSPAMRKN